jgi:hypothetical protein
MNEYSPEGHTSIYMYRKGEGIELTRPLLFTNTTLVLLLCIKVVILCSVHLLCYVCEIALLKLVR